MATCKRAIQSNPIQSNPIQWLNVKKHKEAYMYEDARKRKEALETYDWIVKYEIILKK
jgi:hypothetical protein